MPNILALIVLYGWPVLSYFLFKHLSLSRAMIWTIVIGYLFMPPASVAFDLPILPAITKIEMASLSALFMTLAFYGRKAINLPKSIVMRIILGTYIFVPVITLLANTDPIYNFLGPDVLHRPGHSFFEVPSFVISRFFTVIPFILAYSILKRREHLKEVLVAIVSIATYHSVLMLFEIRFSPQLNIWIYGFFQHSFAQMVRGGGFRPIVFLYHALWLGFFMVMAVSAAISLYRHSKNDGQVKFFSAPDRVFGFLASRRTQNIYLMLAVYFAAIIVASKSYGPIMYMMLLSIILVTTNTRTQLSLALLISSAVILYPLTKAFALFPEDQMIAFFASFNSDRAGSLAFRLFNETILFDRVLERPFFGWGGYGRNLVYVGTSTLLTIPDGGWIIELGQYGFVGWSSQNGLMLAPVFLAFSRRDVIGGQNLSPHLSTIALLLAINAVDMIPNATLTTITFLLSGAAWANLEERSNAEQAESVTKRATTRRSIVILSQTIPRKKRTIL